MPIINLHEKPFDEGTIAKLELFEEYAKAWLPTFIMSHYKEVWIFDFFAGTGYDIEGTAGSSIRLLRQIKNQIGNIFQKNIKINICLNELEKPKYNELVESCNRYLDENKDVKRAINVHYRNCDFAILFPKCIETIQQYPSLVFLDQNGIKFIAEKYILDLEKTKTTDFLYYISSSYFWRFGNTKAFKDLLGFDMDTVKKNPFKYIHVSILDQLRKKISVDSDLVLYPFTIKKQSAVYGIIFGAKHPRAVDKFLKTAWEMNEVNGAANFDIDDDATKNQLDLFEGKILTKIQLFSNKLRIKLLSKELTNNKEVFDFALKEGHISKHAIDEIKKMKKEGLLDYSERSPLINYDQVYKNKRLIEYKLIQR